jgi:superfamily I DNA/RNA helicase
LEWEHLFLVRVSVGAFPSVRLDRQELAEERRLAHVAMTRAASSLTVSRAAWLRSRFAARADFDFFADRGLLVAFEQTA